VAAKAGSSAKAAFGMAPMLAAARAKWKGRSGKTAMHDRHQRVKARAAYSAG